MTAPVTPRTEWGPCDGETCRCHWPSICPDCGCTDEREAATPATTEALRETFVDLEIALSWALHYIEYCDVVPSSERDEREGENDRRMWESAHAAITRAAALTRLSRESDR
jgi:hypothetical protein